MEVQPLYRCIEGEIPYLEIIDEFVEENNVTSFVVISDTHCQQDLIKLPQADVLLHCGDFSFSGDTDEVEFYVDWLQKLKPDFKQIVIIAGNHDTTIDDDFYNNRGTKYPKKFLHYTRQNTEQLRKMLCQNENFIYLQDSGCEINGIKIYGSPWTPEFNNFGFNLRSQEQAEDIWGKIPNQIDILMTHGPPFEILDKTDKGKSVGCKFLRKRIDQIQLQFHLFGHIHSGYGIQKINNSLYLNAATCNEDYKPVNPPIKFRIKNKL